MYLIGEISPNTQRFQGHQQPDSLARLEAFVENLVSHPAKRYKDAEVDPLDRLEALIENLIKRHDNAEGMLRNQQVSISNSEKQMGQIAQVLQEQIPEGLDESSRINSNAQVNAISTWSETIFSQPRLVNNQSFRAKMDLKEQKNENENSNSFSAPYKPPIPFPNRLRQSKKMDKSTNDSNSCDNAVFSIETVNFVVQETIDEVEKEEKQIQRNEDQSLDAKQEIEELEKLLEEEVEFQIQEPKEHASLPMRNEQLCISDANMDEFDDILNKDLEELLGYSWEEETIEDKCDLLVISDLTPHTNPQGINSVHDHQLKNSQEDNQEAEKIAKPIQVTNPLKGNKKEMNDLVEKEKFKYGVVEHPKTNENFPKKIPPKPPDHSSSTKKGTRGEGMEGVKASPDANVTT